MSRHFARGSAIQISVQFFDVDGDVTSPSSATLYVTYLVDGVAITETIEMVADETAAFSATWDSSSADPGLVDWHARSAGPNQAARDGTFYLIANSANPETV